MFPIEFAHIKIINYSTVKNLVKNGSREKTRTDIMSTDGEDGENEERFWKRTLVSINLVLIKRTQYEKNLYLFT